jgi:hypothetical protein
LLGRRQPWKLKCSVIFSSSILLHENDTKMFVAAILAVGLMLVSQCYSLLWISLT